MSESAGQALRREFDEALARTGKQCGSPLSWTEHDSAL